MIASLDNVNFRLLVRSHNGDIAKATAAWNRILQIGGFGSVPVTYEGGLDIRGIRIAREEYDRGDESEFVRKESLDFDAIVDKHFMSLQVPLPKPVPPTSDDIKRIEDIAAGDKPISK